MKQTFKMEIWEFKEIILVGILLILGISLVFALSNNCCGNFCIDREGYCDSASSKDVCEQDSCEIGCCQDKEGFEHNNYPKERCISYEGKFYSGKCKNSFFCG